MIKIQKRRLYEEIKDDPTKASADSLQFCELSPVAITEQFKEDIAT